MMDAIDAWIPVGGIEKLKSDVDAQQEAENNNR